jgi:hypothetical protein
VISINLFLFPVPVSKRIVTPGNFAQIGDSWQISEDLCLQMKAFTCLLHGGKEVSCVNDLRYNKISAKCCSTGETFDG